MNNLFSEIFGCYYQVITEIVNNSPLSTEEIRNIININGYTETCFHLLPKLETLPFIEKRNGKYYSLLENKIKMPITNIEKSWLKAISKDSRFGLFVNDFDESILGNIEHICPDFDAWRIEIKNLKFILADTIGKGKFERLIDYAKKRKNARCV